MRFRVGLALGGGGVRGLAHLGILKALKEEGISPDLIVGTSMGAIVGAAFSLTDEIERLRIQFLELAGRRTIEDLEVFLASSAAEEKKIVFRKFLGLIKDVIFWKVKGDKKWLIDSSAIIDILKVVIPEEAQFSDTKIPFACIACDLLTGEEVVLKEGPLLKAVLASSSIPGIFPPMRLDNRLLVDGGITSLMPAEAAKKLGADFVIGVNTEGFRLKDNFSSNIDILFQAEQIRARWLNLLNLKSCDFIFEPKVKNYSWAEFSRAKSCVLKGEEEGKEKVKELGINIKIARRKKLFKNLLCLAFLPLKRQNPLKID